MRFEKTHGLSKHPLYRTHREILRRCTDPNRPAYANYGARGIRMFVEWHNLRRFIYDIESEIGPRPAGLTLDRKDNEKDYQPGNIKWATASEQARNRRYHGFHQPRVKNAI